MDPPEIPAAHTDGTMVVINALLHALPAFVNLEELSLSHFDLTTQQGRQ